MSTAFVALGSNLGERRDYLERALALLREVPGVRVGKVSTFHETAPVGGPPGQDNYLNGAAEIDTSLSPGDLLRTLAQIENALGRTRSERWGPRTIDLDLLLYDDLILDDALLTIPHPRLHERGFVLEPLAEIAPHLLHPRLGETIVAMRDCLRGGASAAPMPSSKPGRELTGQRALVTGSTSGIGRAIAEELAAAGADVIVHGRRSRPIADALAARLAEHGIRAHAILADLTLAEQRAMLVEAAWADAPIDIWVNNAGVDTLTGEAARWSFERKLEALWAVDVQATLWLSRAVGARMKARGRGTIVNLGWDQADTGMEGDSAQMFAAAKSAVMAFTKCLALSLAPEVRVNCIAPGWIQTAWGETASHEWQERVRRETPLRRWGRPEDVAAACRWLAAPASSYITGQVVRVNGGAVR